MDGERRTHSPAGPTRSTFPSRRQQFLRIDAAWNAASKRHGERRGRRTRSSLQAGLWKLLPQVVNHANRRFALRRGKLGGRCAATASSQYSASSGCDAILSPRKHQGVRGRRRSADSGLSSVPDSPRETVAGWVALQLPPRHTALDDFVDGRLHPHEDPAAVEKPKHQPEHPDLDRRAE